LEPTDMKNTINKEDYRPVVRTIICASVGVMVGSVGQWVTAGMFAINGLDFGKWGITALTLGAVSCIAMTIEFFWPRDVRWAVPITWAVAVAGVACLSYAVPYAIRVMTLPREPFFVFRMGPAVGWGLWLLALSAAVMSVAASIVASRMGHEERFALARRVATFASAGIVMSSIGYFSAHWDNDNNVPGPSAPIPTFPPFPTNWPLPETTTSTGTSTTSTATVTNTPSPTTPPGGEGNFLSAVRGEDVKADDAALLNAGHQACAGFSQGRASEDMVDDLTDLTGSRAKARALINDAKVFLCPQ
jgi:Protein of unknown function (DUF732)